MSGPNYQQALRDFVGETLFLPTDDLERRETVLSAMASAPQYVMVSAFEALCAYDAASAARVTAPSLYIAADEAHPRSDMNRVREILPDMAFGQTVGSGHFCQLEVPDQVNAMIDRFLRVTLPDKAP